MAGLKCDNYVDPLTFVSGSFFGLWLNPVNYYAKPVKLKANPVNLLPYPVKK